MSAPNISASQNKCQILRLAFESGVVDKIYDDAKKQKKIHLAHHAFLVKYNKLLLDLGFYITSFAAVGTVFVAPNSEFKALGMGMTLLATGATLISAKKLYDAAFLLNKIYKPQEHTA